MDDHRIPFHFATGHQYIQALAEKLREVYEMYGTSNAVYLYVESAPGPQQLQIINVNSLRSMIDQAFCAVRLVIRGDHYERDRYQLDLSRQAVSDVLAELLKIVPPAPLMIKTLGDREAGYAIQRLKSGEPPSSIARAYGVSETAVLELRRHL